MTIRWLDVIDILLVAFLIFQLYKLTKGTVAIKIFIGIISMYLLWKLVTAFQMEMLGEILGQFMAVGVIALLIVFQQELRRFLLLIGTTEFFKADSRVGGVLARLLKQDLDSSTNVTAIVKACERMSSTKTGALIVVARQSDPLPYTKNGEELDAKLSSRLIESIFYKNSPLHDGAILIAEDRISVTRAVLPVTDNEDFPAELGMRHRSAVGITEQTDAISIIVSEQTGGISYAKEGKLMRDLSAQMLEDQLNEDLKPTSLEKEVVEAKA
jgi:diadenylate cyclase